MAADALARVNARVAQATTKKETPKPEAKVEAGLFGPDGTIITPDVETPAETSEVDTVESTVDAESDNSEPIEE